MIYAKLISTTAPVFQNKSLQIFTGEDAWDTLMGISKANLQPDQSIIIPDDIVLCGGCNLNLYPKNGYMVYLDKKHLESNAPRDIYCESCLITYFPQHTKLNRGDD